MDVFEAIEKRRSVRSLVQTEIPMSDIEKIVDAGRRAPSGNNAQPREFIIITNSQTIEKLAIAQGFIREASVVIAIVADESASRYWLEDVSASTENMLLAATALGYASCWVEGTLLRVENEAKAILGVPKDKRLIVAIPLGKSAREGSQANKKPMNEIVHYEKYGQKWKG
jgi:nitroreductase